MSGHLVASCTPTASHLPARFFTTLLTAVEETRHIFPLMVDAAEKVAALLLAGGRLFIGSGRPDFVSEAIVRSGGLMLIHECSTDTVGPEDGDAVLWGWSDMDHEAERARLGRVAGRGAFTVGMGPCSTITSVGEWTATLDIFLENTASPPTDVLNAFANSPYPIISLQNLVLLWTFTGELVAALTRGGHMPTMYQSVLVPGARQRNEQRVLHRFEAEHGVPPIDPGTLAGTYVDRLGDCLRNLASHEIESIEQIADAGASTLRQGQEIYVFLISHFPVHQYGAPGDPRLMRKLSQLHGETPSLAELEAELKPGDLFLFLGYYNRPTEAYNLARQRGVTIAEVITGPAAENGPTPDLAIRPWWPYGDALVPVPNYDIPILPASGIIQAAIYWAVVGTMGRHIVDRS